MLYLDSHKVKCKANGGKDNPQKAGTLLGVAQMVIKDNQKGQIYPISFKAMDMRVTSCVKPQPGLERKGTGT